MTFVYIIYLDAVTSSCQLRECFYNNRSLINTAANSTNQLIYHRSENFINGPINTENEIIHHKLKDEVKLEDTENYFYETDAYLDEAAILSVVFTFLFIFFNIIT